MVKVDAEKEAAVAAKETIISYMSESKYSNEFDANLQQCKNEFLATFGAEKKEDKKEEANPLVCVCAPGRVNLIGEHIDYNEGFVLPMAIPLYTIIVGRARRDNEKSDGAKKACQIKSLEKCLGSNNSIELSLDVADKLEPLEAPYNWTNYIVGVISLFKDKLSEKGGSISSFDCVIKSNVPVGAGLSSSAALEVAMHTFLENLTGQFESKLEDKALICQRAENEFAGVPCGVMDQFIITMGKQDHALLIDCRSYASQLVEINNKSVTFVVVNSNVKHQLEGSEYSVRREQCEHVAKQLLGTKSLRDVASLDELNKVKDQCSDDQYRRAKHAVTEIARTRQACEALKSSDLALFGRLMNESHDSLRDDFNVSCAELDELVEIARETEGVYGSRMTGGGFGGCTVTLVDASRVENLVANIISKYSGGDQHKKPSIYVCKPCNGTRKVLL